MYRTISCYVRGLKRRHFERFGHRGATIASIYLAMLRQESPIPLPPLPEQRRIAEILDKADALRAKRRAALAQLDTLTQSIFLDMFGDPATNPKGWPTASLATYRGMSRIGTAEVTELYTNRDPFPAPAQKGLKARRHGLGNRQIVFEEQHLVLRTRGNAGLGDMLLAHLNSRRCRRRRPPSIELTTMFASLP